MTLPIFPGADIDPVIEIYSSGNRPNMTMLAYFDFQTSDPMALWPGEFDLVAGSMTWKGTAKSGVLCNIDGLESAATLEASQFNVTLSGVEADLIAIAGDTDRGDYVGQMMGVYLLFCDAYWKPVADPLAIAAGFMGTMTVARTQNGDGWQRTISLPVNNMFYGRGVAPASFWTDPDQQKRFPGAGDTGMQFITQLQDYTIRQPWN